MLHSSIGLSVLVLGIGITRGQYYWIFGHLGALLGIVLTLEIVHIQYIKSAECRH